MKMQSLLLAMPLLLMACSDDAVPYNDPATVPTEVLAPTVRTTAAAQPLYAATDKAVYTPGQTVTFTLSGTLPASARVRYRHGSDIIADETLAANTWTWTVPQTDYTGYMADIYTADGSAAETVYATVGIDASSDWARYPRYGFISTYDQSKTSEVIGSELALLSRCHINGLQFYDWQNKHHWPLGGTPGHLLDTYKDIANRDISTAVVKDYIAQGHALGMKTMFYNLCYGALDDASDDGVQEQWHIYTDATHSNKDRHQLSKSWKSDIYLVDPANTEWQKYLGDRNDEVYTALDFDGFHIDQLGNRGTDYDYYGSVKNFPSAYASFIKAMKQRHPDKRLVMNAVSNYGSEKIVKTGDIDFMYTELWSGEDQFADLHDILHNNRAWAGTHLGQVYAAYMDYGHKKPTFNAPGVLLTDAVMFALGASHLELGDGHMLSSEYFPYADIQMSDSLQTAVIAYYDFLTAYQNLLRDPATETTADIATSKSGVTLNAWPPRLKTVTTLARQTDNRLVVHLLNFSQANSLSWRDMDGTQPEPAAVSDMPLRLRAKGVKKLWVASPDRIGGAPETLTFRQEGEYVVFTVPQLKYWTMIVAEQ